MNLVCDDCGVVPQSTHAEHRLGAAHTAQRIRNGLAKGFAVAMACFNKAEADEVAALLTPDERSRTRFSWLVFGSTP